MKNTSIEGSWEKSTIDNDATWGQIRLLAKVYNATGTEKYKEGCLKGIDLLMVDQDIQLHQIRSLISLQFIIKGSISPGP